MMTETWKPIVGFEAYEVSDHGRARSLDREVTDSNGIVRKRKGKILAIQHIPSSGQAVVNLYKGGEQHCRSLAKLVLEAFVGPAPVGHWASGDLEGCRLADLSWQRRAAA
jgi:hypothetical protein